MATVVFSYPQYAPPQAFTEDGRPAFTLSVRPELWRFRAFVFFWTSCLLGLAIARIWVEPRLGAEIAALCFPFFEYSFVVYTLLDLCLHMASYQKGEIPEWYWSLVRFATPIVIVLVFWFRMVFVATTHENPALHEASLVGMKIALFVSSTTNAAYIWLTGQSYPTIGLSAEKTGLLAKIFLLANAFLSVPEIVWGASTKHRVHEALWMVFNAVLPLAIARARMEGEDPFTVELTAPVHAYDASTKPGADGTPSGDNDNDNDKDNDNGNGTMSNETTPLVVGSTGGTDGGSTSEPKGRDVEDPAGSGASAASAPGAAAPAPTPEQPAIVDPKIVTGQAALDAIKGTPTLNSGLSEIYNEIGHRAAEIRIVDGGWISDVFLPPGGCPEGATLIVRCDSTWKTNIRNVQPRDRVLATGQRVELEVAANGSWTEKAWVDEKGVLVVSGQEELNRHKGTDGKYFFVVADKTVVHHSADIEDCKKYLNTRHGIGATLPSRMIAEVSGGGVARDPHTVAGQNQGGGINAGFNKWWKGWPDIHGMTAVAEEYLSKHRDVVQPPKNDNLLHAFTVKDYKDVEIQTRDGSWIRELILPDPNGIVLGSTLTVRCGSTWAVRVTDPGKWTKTVNNKQTVTLAVSQGGGGKKVWK